MLEESSNTRRGSEMRREKCLQLGRRCFSIMDISRNGQWRVNIYNKLWVNLGRVKAACTGVRLAVAGQQLLSIRQLLGDAVQPLLGDGGLWAEAVVVSRDGIEHGVHVAVAGLASKAVVAPVLGHPPAWQQHTLFDPLGIGSLPDSEPANATNTKEVQLQHKHTQWYFQCRLLRC